MHWGCAWGIRIFSLSITSDAFSDAPSVDFFLYPSLFFGAALVARVILLPFLSCCGDTAGTQDPGKTKPTGLLATGGLKTEFL